MGIDIYTRWKGQTREAEAKQSEAWLMTGAGGIGYPFNSEEEYEKACLYAELDAKLHVELIEKRAARLPEAYGKAFRYIAYRDLNERMKMYLEIAEERIQPQTCDPRLVARHA
jgi:hypothetical protein